MNLKAVSALIFSYYSICFTCSGQSPDVLVNGEIRDDATNELLPGATVLAKDNTMGTITDNRGQFQLILSPIKDSLNLYISYIGYESSKVKIDSFTTYLEIRLKSNQLIANEVVVTASRINERILESPVSILKLDPIAIRLTASENFYTALSNYKGVDILTNSILYKTINTRGFNNSANLRMVQLVDGINNSLIGLGWPLGNVLGPTDLDVERVELIPGAASALYGANAFNGLIYISTKDPFSYPGLSVQIKNGINRLGNTSTSAAWYTDMQLRYAQAINKHLGFKVNLGYIKGSDWVVTDSSDLDYHVSLANRGANDPGRDAVNIYGDEVVAPLPLAVNSVYVSRTGYYIKDLMDNTSYSFKVNGSVNYKLTNTLQLSDAFSFAQATVRFNNQFDLKNIKLYSNKLELSGDNFFVRGSIAADDLGDTYNSKYLALIINNRWKQNKSWFSDFRKAYSGLIENVAENDFEAARDYADIGRLVPGTLAFDHVKDSLKALPFGKGSKVIDHSSRYYFQGEYNFSQLIKSVSLIAGADYSISNLKSDSSIFIDTPGHPIFFNQYAVYAQATKKIFRDRLKLLASLRLDKIDIYKGVWSPRLAAVFHPDDENYIRASFQTGFRLPGPQDLYNDIDLGPQHLLGGLPMVDAPYQVHYHSFTYESQSLFSDTVRNYLLRNPGLLDSAISKYKELLMAAPYGYIKPEKIQTFELGYQRLWNNGKLYTDIDYFHNKYTNLISQVKLIKPGVGGPENDSITSAAYAIYASNYVTYVIPANAFNIVNVDGIEASVSYAFPKGFLLSGNLTFIRSNITPEKLLPGLRTPPLKSNVTLSKTNAFRNIGFMINWRWTDAIARWDNLNDITNIDNSLPAVNIIDAEVSYHFTKLNTTLKIGASNLFNYYHQDYPGGSSIGGIYYVSFLYEIFKLRP
ncbi:MAG: TonB-dependent receptor [Chitinophagales bacterium]|nr:TonB-dependent receptor [Chitinophagales bacterium]